MDLLETQPALSFFVPGRPQTAGSKSAFQNKVTGKIIVTESGDRVAKKTWRADLRAAAEAAAEREGWQIPGPDAALHLTIVIVRARPKGHMGSGKNAGIIKDSRRAVLPVARPDLTKLERAIEDALTGILWRDDSAVCEKATRKVFGDQLPGGDPLDEGAHVRVSLL